MLRSLAAAASALALLAVLPAPARAAPGGPWASTPAPVTFAGALDLFDAISFDSGWQPAGSAVQVRFEVFLGSGFTCTMDGTALLTWPPPLDLAFDPTPGSGELVMDVGLEVHSLYHFDLGGGVVWEGELPYLPNFDYRFAGVSGLDPFLLPGASPASATVTDTIPDTLLYMFDLTDALVPIPGIGGGVALYAGGQLDATLSGNDIRVDPEIVTTEGEHVFPAVPGADPALLRDAIWEGQLLLAGTLTLTPAIYVELLGTIYDVAAFPIPLPFPAAPLAWALDPWPLDLALPEIEVDAQNVAFAETAPGSMVVEGVPVRNDGDLDLVVTTTVSGGPGLAPAAVAPFVVPAHTIGIAAVVFAPAAPGAVTGTLTIASNDPDEPVITVPVYATGADLPASDAGPLPASDGGAPDAGGPDAGPADDAQPGGCGCRCSVAAPRASAAVAPFHAMLAVLALLVALRRRRRPSR